MIREWEERNKGEEGDMERERGCGNDKGRGDERTGYR